MPRVINVKHFKFVLNRFACFFPVRPEFHLHPVHVVQEIPAFLLENCQVWQPQLMKPYNLRQVAKYVGINLKGISWIKAKCESFPIKLLKMPPPILFLYRFTFRFWICYTLWAKTKENERYHHRYRMFFTLFFQLSLLAGCAARVCASDSSYF